MEQIGTLAIKLTATVFLAVFVITALYIWVLPHVFPGAKTYSILVAGVSVAGVIGAYYGYHAIRVVESSTVKLGTALAAGVSVAVLVGLLSLFIVLNVRGS